MSGIGSPGPIYRWEPHVPDPTLLEAFASPTDEPFVVEHINEEFTSVCIGCVPTSRALYADFATEFWDVPFDLNTTGSSRYSKAHTALEVKFGRQGRKFDWMRPHVFGKGESRGRFIRYGTRHPGAHYDVIVHARDMVKGSKGGDRRRCSPRAFWDSLSDAMKGMGLEVACIGLKEGALTLPHAADMRRGASDGYGHPRQLVGDRRAELWTDSPGGVV